MTRPTLNLVVALVWMSVIVDSSRAEKPVTTKLFDDKSLDGWVTGDGKPVTKGWKAVDGMLHRETRGGHIYYAHEVGNFELAFDWKIAERGNSGLKYRVRKYGKKTLGCEYQIYDDRGKPFHKQATGSLYGMYEPNQEKQPNPPGQWNSAKIIVRDAQIEHWLNGKQIVNAKIGSDDWWTRHEKSKFQPYAKFAWNLRGKIMLQDHGAKVWYRNMNLTHLPTSDQPELDLEQQPTNSMPAEEK